MVPVDTADVYSRRAAPLQSQRPLRTAQRSEPLRRRTIRKQGVCPACVPVRSRCSALAARSRSNQILGVVMVRSVVSLLVFLALVAVAPTPLGGQSSALVPAGSTWR